MCTPWRRERPWVEFRAPTPCKDPHLFLSPLRRSAHGGQASETHFFLSPVCYSDSSLISVAPRNQSQARSSSLHKCLTAQCDFASSTPRGIELGHPECGPGDKVGTFPLGKPVKMHLLFWACPDLQGQDPRGWVRAQGPGATQASMGAGPL